MLDAVNLFIRNCYFQEIFEDVNQLDGEFAFNEVSLKNVQNGRGQDDKGLLTEN